jgi:citrate lyase subunit beta/citryl-CoA lyase
MIRRSVLFSPGDRPALLRKAPRTGADTVVFDLEDAVLPEAKPAARESVAGVLGDPSFDPDCEVCVRLDSDPETAKLDAEAVTAADPRLDSIAVPKAESPSDVHAIHELVAARGYDRPVIALCESAAGILAAEEIAAADPVDAVAFGAEDLAADIGATRTDAGTEVSHARQHVVLAAGAAGVDAIDALVTDVEAERHLTAEAESARRLGYDGKMAIHPDQVEIINDAFSPPPEDVEWAKRVLEAAEAAERAGRGVVRVDDEMIDAPLIARAETILERHEAAGN